MTQVFTGHPTITTHPTSQLTNVSMSVTLDCEGTGRGSITYHWETSNNNGGQWMNISNSNNKRYLVRDLKQSRQYRCVVSNEAGGTRSDVAIITLLGKLYRYVLELYYYMCSPGNRNHHSTSQSYNCHCIRRCYINLFSIC